MENTFKSIQVNLSKYGQLGSEISNILKSYDGISINDINQTEFINQFHNIIDSQELELMDKMIIVNHLSSSLKEFETSYFS